MASGSPSRSPRAHGPQDPAGQDPRTEAAPARALDSRALRTVLFDLWGRPPRREESQAWLGKGLHELLDTLLGGEAFWRHWWEEQLYYFLLVDEFRPETQTAKAVPGKLSARQLNAREALHQLALTPTFDLRNPGADTFVTVVMEQFCGIIVQEGGRKDLDIGKRIYDGGDGKFLGKKGSNQSDVIRTCIEHKRASQHFLRREYERLIWRAPDKGELRKWASRYHKNPSLYPTLVREWLLSDAYATRLTQDHPKSNRLFVRGLFVDLTDQLPEDEDLEAMRTALDGLADSRPLRGVLARMLIDSGRAELPDKSALEDSGDWISGQFHRLLGRGPADAELERFRSVLGSPACTTGTVLYALVSSAEYHSY